MSEYRRFISYIYRYVRGRKENNCGFVKAEIRGSICRLQMHLERSECTGNSLSVYGFVREGDYLLGLFLGNAAAKGTACDFQMSTPAQRFADTDYAALQVRGIWLRGEDGENYITVWDDEPVKVERFVTELPKQEQETVQPDLEKENRQEEEMQEEMQKQEMQKEQTAYKNQTESESEQKSDYQMGAAAMSSLAERWENFCYHYPAMDVFADEEITDCLRIMPKDLSFLGSARWGFAQSPFVLQAAAKYHHLMIGRHQNGSFVLGIPGQYGDMQNRQLARMYGFPMFKAANRQIKQERELTAADVPETGTEAEFSAEQKNMEETFGYWYQFMD